MRRLLFACLLSLLAAGPSFAQVATGLSSLNVATSYNDTDTFALCQNGAQSCSTSTYVWSNGNLGGLLNYAAARTGSITNKTLNCSLNTCTNIPTSALVGALSAAQFPALTGDVTTVAGGLATTLITVNPNVGNFTCTNVTVNGKGLVTAAANGPCNAVSLTAGNAGISMSPSPITGAGIISLALSGGGAVSHEWINSLSAAGVATLSQPAFTDISGSPSATQLETNLAAAFYNQFPPTNGDCLIGTGSTASFTTCPGGSGGSGTVGSGSTNQIAAYGAGGTTVGGYTMAGDATGAISSTNYNLTVTKTNGTPFANSATTDTTNASNISSGTLPAGRMPALTGDVTTSAGAVATTLATVNGSPGSTTCSSVTTNGKGLVTANSSGTCVNSVSGTTGQVTVTGTNNPVVSLPSTITANETFSGEEQFTGGEVVPPSTSPCGTSITPTIGTQNIECSVTAATTLNVPSPFVAGETYYVTLQEGSSPFPISVAANIYIPGGGIAQLQQPAANDRDKLVCNTTVIGGTNSLDCGQLVQLRQPPSYHVGCNNNTGSTVSAISCSFSSYTPPVGSVVMLGVTASSATTTSLFSSATFTGSSGGTCVVPASNGFNYQSAFGAGYYVVTCQITTGGATGVTVNFSSSVSGASLIADVINNSYGIDTNNVTSSSSSSSTPGAGPITPTQQDMVWSYLRCGSCGTVTAGANMTIGQNVSGIQASEYGIVPANIAASPVFNASSAAGYGAAVAAVLP